MNNINSLIKLISFVFISPCLGSFFKLVIDRHGSGESIIYKGSFCTKCKKKLFWWQNIPIIGFLLLKGKCFFCKSKLDTNLLLSEIAALTIGIMVFLLNLFNKINTQETLIMYFFSMLLILLSMFDLKHRIVPHFITYTAIILTIAYKYFTNKDLYEPFLNLGIAFLFMDFLYLFSMKFKNIPTETNLISIPVLLWVLIFFFYKNLLLIFIPIVIYFLLNNKSLLTKKITDLSWYIIFILLSLHIFTSNGDLNSLVLLVSGIGVIYFICEILIYFFIQEPQNIETGKSKKQIVTIGGGDITLFALISVVFNFKFAFGALFLASLIGLISHFIQRLSLKTRKQSSQQIPFVPYLSLACFIIIVISYGF